MAKIQTFQIKYDSDLKSTGICLVHGTCYAYKVAKEDVSAFLKANDELDTCGVYLLLADGKVYVGEAESVSGRLRQHLARPPYDWNEAIGFVGMGSASDWEKSSIKYMEHGICADLIACGGYEVQNGNTPKQSKVALPWVWDEQIEEIKSLLPYLGHPKLFAKAVKPMPKPASNEPQEEIGNFPYKIGLVARTVFPILFERGLISKKEIDFLTANDSKRFFHTSFPILRKRTGEQGECRDAKGHYRYYTDIQLKRHGETYCLSHELYAKGLPSLLNWFASLGVSRAEVKELCEKAGAK